MAKAKFRMVHTSFWNDPYVSEEMTAEDKYFFLYLLTNEHTTQIGIYGITKKQMAFELGYSIESINALMHRFITHHDMIRYNEQTRELAVKNWGKFNLNKGGKPVIDCVNSELKQVKDLTLIQYVSKKIENAVIKGIYDSYHESLTIRGQKEEQEEEGKTPSSHPLIEQDFLNIQKHYKEHVVYRELDYKETLALSDLMDQYQPQLIIEAMNISVARHKPYLGYAEGVLRNWRLDGITNIQQLQAKEAQGNATTQRSNASHTPKNQAESEILQRAASYTGDYAKYKNL